MSSEGRPSGAPSRRTVLQAAACGFVGLTADHRSAPAVPPTNTSQAANKRPNPLAAKRPIWNLQRPKPALPNSMFWTWDHSANWMLDDPGVLNFGCDNRYLKHSETFVEDYRRLTDLAAGLGVKGIIIWGFLRDAHGGVAAAKCVADYAAARGVAILPGVGTNFYGGVYYEGDHPYCITTFLRKHPDAHAIGADGQKLPGSVCPSHPRFATWIQEAVRWLFREFAIGGVNLENGDFFVCHCPKCRARDEGRPQNEPAFWHHQYLGYGPVLQAIAGQLNDKLVTWATYKGFLPGSADHRKDGGAAMMCARPLLVDTLPQQAIAQWTLTGMLRDPPLPLTAYLGNGAPPESLARPFWPTDLKPPSTRSVGFLHQGSQWNAGTDARPRYQQVVSTIKEGCLRAHRSGLQGVVIHGEVSSTHVPWALNYLAFSHFIHWPEDSLYQFGAKTLSQVLGTAEEGEAYAELLAHWDAGSLSDAQKHDVRRRSKVWENAVLHGQHVERWRFWNWLMHVAEGTQDRQTVGIF
jgi:hypothetical protein